MRYTAGRVLLLQLLIEESARLGTVQWWGCGRSRIQVAMYLCFPVVSPLKWLLLLLLLRLLLLLFFVPLQLHCRRVARKDSKFLVWGPGVPEVPGPPKPRASKQAACHPLEGTVSWLASPARMADQPPGQRAGRPPGQPAGRG